MRDVVPRAVVRVVELARVHLAIELHLLDEHLRHEARKDDGDEEDPDGVEDARELTVLSVKERRQEPGEEHVQKYPRRDEQRVLHAAHALVPEENPQLASRAVGKLAGSSRADSGERRALATSKLVHVAHRRDVRLAKRRRGVEPFEIVRPSRGDGVGVEGVDEVLGDVEPRTIREALRGEEVQRGASAGTPVRHPTVIEQHEALEGVEHRGSRLVNGDHEGASLLIAQRAQVEHHLPRHGRVEAAGRLVEKHALGGTQERARHGRALHLSAAHAADQPVAHERVRAPLEVQLIYHGRDLSLLVGDVVPGREGELGHRREQDRLANGGAPEETVLLLDVRGVLLHRRLGGNGTVEIYLMRGGPGRNGEMSSVSRGVSNAVRGGERAASSRRAAACFLTLPRTLPSVLRLLMMSRRVVLPAPLGPMTAHISPA